MKTIIHFHLIIITSALLSVDSCNKKKETTSASSATYTQAQTTTTSTTSSTAATSTASTTTASVAPKDENMRFVVSFYSTASGIDLKINDEFVKFLDSYPKKINYTPSHWGREGEIDYCLALKELTPSEQTEFVKKANEILVKSKLVHIKENAKCDHINWPGPIIPSENNSYRLVVSFYSTTSGIDLKTNDEFVKFLNSYPKKINYEPTHWGREGEIDYCLKLSELSSAEQGDFVKKAKEILSKSTLVHVNENAACVHKH